MCKVQSPLPLCGRAIRSSAEAWVVGCNRGVTWRSPPRAPFGARSRSLPIPRAALRLPWLLSVAPSGQIFTPNFDEVSDGKCDEVSELGNSGTSSVYGRARRSWGRPGAAGQGFGGRLQSWRRWSRSSRLGWATARWSAARRTLRPLARRKPAGCWTQLRTAPGQHDAVEFISADITRRQTQGIPLIEWRAAIAVGGSNRVNRWAV